MIVLSKANKTRRRQSGVYIGEKKGLSNSILRLFGADCSVVVPSKYCGPVAIVGGSGSGKTAGVVLPTLCRTYRNGNFFAVDIKGDLSTKYAEANPGEVAKVFSLRGETEYTYEPFDYIREDGEDNLVSNMRELVNALIPLPANVKDPFWIQSSREFLTGGLLYYYDMKLSFVDAAKNIMTTPPATLINKISQCGNDQIKSFVNNFIGADNCDNKLLVGIGQEVANRLSVIANDPRVCNSFSPSDKKIQWADLETYNIFLSVPEDWLEQYGPVVTMMLTQLIRNLERRSEKHSAEGVNQRQVLLMLDEFPRLGKLDTITSAVSTLRSKNVTLCLVLQSLAQLDMVYGKDVRRVIMDNCSYMAILGVNDVESQKYFAERAGTVLVRRNSKSTSYVPVRDAPSPTEPVYRQITGYSEQESVTREYTIQPHEFSTMKDIIFFTPSCHQRVKKSPYYKTVASTTKPSGGTGNAVRSIETVEVVLDRAVEFACSILKRVKSFFSFCFGG